MRRRLSPLTCQASIASSCWVREHEVFQIHATDSTVTSLSLPQGSLNPCRQCLQLASPFLATEDSLLGLCLELQAGLVLAKAELRLRFESTRPM